MFELRPDRLQVAIDSQGGYNEYGDPIPINTQSWSAEVPCRIIQDDKVNVRTLEDGSLRYYQYCVVLDDLQDCYKGRTIRLIDKSGDVVCERVVESRKIGQIIQRLWP